MTAEDERAAVVRWLRADAKALSDGPTMLGDYISEAINECADAIEAGAHREGEGK